jgi:hypothetical protein
MSEITKFIAEIAIITLKNLSDALLQSVSEISKLNHTPEPLSQAQDKHNFASSAHTELAKRQSYKLRDRVIVDLNPPYSPSRMTISQILEANEYMAYHWMRSKNSARKITHNQILGLDPKR